MVHAEPTTDACVNGFMSSFASFASFSFKGLEFDSHQRPIARDLGKLLNQQCRCLIAICDGV